MGKKILAIVFFLFKIITLLIAVLLLVLKILWDIVSYPFKKLIVWWRSRDFEKFYKANIGKKFMFYTSSNYKVVEQYLLPLLDDSFIVYFIEDGDFEAWGGELHWQALFIDNDFVGGFPYFIKLTKKNFDYLSFRQDLARLKKGKISTVYAQSTINFFFSSDID